ncbi:MAG: hypothetical protein O7E52_21495 [Candidatus Poribacteria bacterium]|nr:hypothetical protein [Candidatus Poribacteria bacterium]
MTDIANILRADTPSGSSQVILFIPSKDREGKEVDQESWVDEGLSVVGRLFRGGTAFPPGKGVWRNDAQGGQLLFETTVMILSFVEPNDLTDFALLQLKAFLLRLGREANQGEVGVVIDGIYYGFTQFEEG